MSFFGSVKRAFGFSDTEDDYIDEGIDATVHKPSSEPGNLYQQNTPEEEIHIENTEPQNSTQDTKFKHEIFDSVISIFNQSLPDFIKTCVDVEAQRKYIYDSLDESLKAYIDKVGNDARQRGASMWESERKKIQDEIKQLREQHRHAEENRADWQRQQLSAERQKRALSDRVHDLENQINKLEAEKEQYDLENKSLINKLKVSTVKDGDLEEMRQEIATLQARLKEARDTDKANELQALIDTANASIADKDREIATLRENLAQLETGDNTTNDNAGTIESLNRQIEEISDENKKLQEAIEQLKTKEQIADTMINDLNAKASKAIRELEEKNVTLETLNTEHSSALVQIEQLQEKISLANQELQSSQEELDEARSTLQAVDEIQEQLTRFEEIKRKKDNRISELTEESKVQVERIAQLEEETISLKKTIEKNLYSQAESERLLKSRIDELTAELKNKTAGAATNNPTPTQTAEKPPKKKRQVKISAIDESLDDTDWLVAVPPPGTPTRPSSPTSENDFGYQAPVRKSTPENEAQMSLW
ncbi:MAG: hypothetical protein IJY31_05960 [Muribaculaceae bacterium]|nr:hypothetical protein [Muribaculaceae bacterium]